MGAQTYTRPGFLFGAILLIQCGLLAWVGGYASPNNDEVGHLGAGCYLWTFGRFDVYRVNPPLVRAVAAFPLLACQANVSWSSYVDENAGRPEWELGKEFVAANGITQAMQYFILARWMCIPFLLLGSLVCYRWATDLFGRASGIIALLLWCFCPNVITWGATICPDAPAAALGITASYLYWRWLKEPSWGRACVAGLMLGVVGLTKLTWIVLFGLWPFLWLVWFWQQHSRKQEEKATVCNAEREKNNHFSKKATWKSQLIQLTSLLAFGLYVINIGYGFDGTFQRLEEYTFVSRTLAGRGSVVDGCEGGNRFNETWLGVLPIPLPKDYLSGLDLQKLDFERGMRSFLCGEWKENGGWWYYYLVCVALKVPLGTWLLGLLAVSVTFWPSRSVENASQSQLSKESQRPFSAGWLNEFTLLLPALVVFVVASFQTGINGHFRYVLPAFPFVYIWISKVAQAFLLHRKLLMAVVCLSMTWLILSSLSVFPHSQAFFNELAGGPCYGHSYLIDTNIDWGQDMWRLKQWYDEHPKARPIGIASRSLLSPEIYGIRSSPIPAGPAGEETGPHPLGLEYGPRPGWYAISAHYIHEPGYSYFLLFKPVEMIGYSVYIYHITLEQANLARKEHGLPELPRS